MQNFCSLRLRQTAKQTRYCIQKFTAKHAKMIHKIWIKMRKRIESPVESIGLAIFRIIRENAVESQLKARQQNAYQCQ
jgi:hypothetical protein